MIGISGKIRDLDSIDPGIEEEEIDTVDEVQTDLVPSSEHCAQFEAASADVEVCHDNVHDDKTGQLA